MPEWLIERGIGETRAALIQEGEIVEARIMLDGMVRAGTILEARLSQAGVSSTALADGHEYLLPGGAPGITHGAAMRIEVTREAIPGAEPWKRALARMTADPPSPVPALTEREIAFLSPGGNALDEAGWDDLIEQARSGMVAFAGGVLRLSPTPAMTLIDVDGALPPPELAVVGAAAAAKAIRRLDIGGSIGIDLPTVGGKAFRLAAASAIDQHLPGPFERTAVNGFGFVQIVRPRRRASLLEMWSDRPAAEARALLRRAAGAGLGARRLVAHPAVASALEHRPAWLDALARQIGGPVSLRADPSLPMSGGHAEPA
ncbi:MAG: ribonuclease [Sphingomonas sp.]|nr:ribonuclease [Sphingomonas sp.]